MGEVRPDEGARGFKRARLLTGAVIGVALSISSSARGAAAPAVKYAATQPGPTTRIVIPKTPVAPKVEEPLYYVSHFVLRYATPREDLPRLSEVEQYADVELARVGAQTNIYAAPTPGVNWPPVKLRDLSQRTPQKYRASGITAVNQAIVKYLNSRGLAGVYVAVDPEDLKVEEVNGKTVVKDLRPINRTDLHLVIATGEIAEVRTITTDAQGMERVNSPRDAKIRENSPIKAGGSAGQNDLIRKNLLDEYVFGLNRRPYRRVDVALSQGNAPGSVVLDYLVTETKPWSIYAQLSNTGTQQTDDWREHFGFVHSNLTGNDDVLSIDYVTAGFDGTSEAVNGSYEAPVPTMDKLRWRGYGGYSTFTASDIGLGNEEFNGRQTTGGGELIANVYQDRDLFIDARAGAHYDRIRTNNTTVAPTLKGAASFIAPYVGLTAERARLTSNYNAAATMTYAVTDAQSGTNGNSSLERLGRADVDTSFFLFQAHTNYSFFLEPIFSREEFDAGSSTLAHEVALSIRGQSSFGKRLVPEYQEVAGGLYSVRGYDESIASGDDVVIGSAEYRYHIPRAWAVQNDPSKTPLFGEPFRRSPQQAYGRPDWDLVLKAFVDAAHIHNYNADSFESKETLVGAGFGIELALKNNINLQAFWGMALKNTPDGQTEAGDNRFHFLFTFLY